jgi:subtilisin
MHRFSDVPPRYRTRSRFCKFRTNLIPFGRSALAALFALLMAYVPASGQNAAGPATGQIVPGRYIVTFQAGVANASAVAQSLAQLNGFRVRHVYANALRGMNIEIPAQAPALPILDALSRNPNVKSVGNDRYAAAVSTDTETLGIQRIFATPTSAQANTGAGVRVAVVDTGLNYDHADLSANIDRNFSVACTGGTDTAPLTLGTCQGGGTLGKDDEGHGTMVGGIIAAAKNNTEIVGVAPDAQLISVKVLDSTGYGTLGDIIAGLDHVMGLSGSSFVNVVNMSLAATCSVCVENSTDPAVFAFQQAVESVVANGTTVVVAASNDGLDASTSVPAAFDAAITVSAMADTDGQPGGNGPSLLFIGLGRQKDDSFAKFSNYGADIDVIAPGVSVTSLALGGGETSGSGTSFASPYAAGVAALFIRSWMDTHGGLAPTPAMVRDALIQTGECADQSFYSDANGCPTVWPGDHDSTGEPLVRADRVADYVPPGPPAPIQDVAVTALSAPSSTLSGTSTTVTVDVANQGEADETFDVTLTDDGAVVAPVTGVTLSPSDTRTIDFSWTPIGEGNHNLIASVTVLPDETDTADNTASTTAWVASYDHDVAVIGVSGDSSVTEGETASFDVEVQNQGIYAENFLVDLTDTTDGTQIASKSVTGLTPGASTTVTLSWSTTLGTAPGPHGLVASVPAITSETDIADNVSDPFTVTVNELAAVTTLHVASLTPSASNDGRTWTASVDITVADNNGSPVAGATVSGNWSNGASGISECTTDVNGICSVSVTGIPKKTGSVTFTVTGVIGSLTYDPNDPYNVASVIVLKP